MDKSTLSVLVGIGLIIIIVESTALASTLHFGTASNGIPPPFKVTQTPTPVVTPTEVIQTPFQEAPSLDTIDTNSTDLETSIVNTSIRRIRAESVVQQQTILPVSKIEYVQHEEPIPDEGDNVSDHLVYVPAPQKTVEATDNVEIFNKNLSFLYNSTAISFNLVNPPMVILYNVTPQIVTLEKYVLNRDAGKKVSDGKIINVTRVDEDSWFQVTAYDKSQNNTIVLQDGFGKDHDQAMTKELVLRNPGNYQLKFEGDFISVLTSIKVPREGNI